MVAIIFEFKWLCNKTKSNEKEISDLAKKSKFNNVGVSQRLVVEGASPYFS